MGVKGAESGTMILLWCKMRRVGIGVKWVRLARPSSVALTRRRNRRLAIVNG